MKQANFFIAVVLAFVVAACSRPVAPFSSAHVDQSVSQQSRYPLAAEPSLVGTYSGRSKSGGGYFYDHVLEYRVWLHPEQGAVPLAGDDDYFAAFAQYESALAFSQAHKGAEPPVVLVRQLESINEPSPGVYQHQSGARITEWQPQWLPGSKREPDSITKFLAAHASTQK
ncbi:hypothetical protein [Xanthomonas arboricola]|nr:hypothetical protein [Xanthomonas arboricola]UOS99322.1 hypothetical protein LZZ50_02795 [Xanthomonas arboricola]